MNRSDPTSRHPQHLRDAMPPMLRGPMTPRPWTGFLRGIGQALRSSGPAEAMPMPPPADWMPAARRRRMALLFFIMAVAATAGALQWQAMAPLPAWQDEPFEVAGSLAFVGLFTLLFAWVSAGCATALMGFWVQCRGDRWALRSDDSVRRPIPRDARTALIMPICNEDVEAVFAGLGATCDSLAATGALSSFDIFVLSDTADPVLRDSEWRAWSRLRARLGDEEPQRVFYRWRRRRSGRKAGNVADFCRRWGRKYRYMVVLDADSVMTGDCLVRLVQLMEAHPRVGIAQTVPQACAPDTLHARAQQFANRVLGRLYVAGLQYWQMGDSHYWGHNAIIRVAPFMAHCALARLPARQGQGAEVLSHDFVEAALMRRAGYEVWTLPDLEGSFEQLPAHLLDELQRDQRWCRGNMRNARLLAEPGLLPVHRALFLTGTLAYASAPLWLAYVVLGLLGPAAAGRPLADTAVALWSLTLALLLLPRMLATAAIWLRGEQRRFGGVPALISGACIEALMATVQAPVRMLAHSLFVTNAVLGVDGGWKSPPRRASQIRWRDALSRLSGCAALLGGALALVAWAEPATAPRLLFLAVPLLLAAPIAVWSSRTDLGAATRREGLLQVPAEARIPAPLRPVDVRAPATTVPARPAATRRPAAAPARWAPAFNALGLALRQSLRAAFAGPSQPVARWGARLAVVAWLTIGAFQIAPALQRLQHDGIDSETHFAWIRGELRSRQADGEQSWWDALPLRTASGRPAHRAQCGWPWDAFELGQALQDVSKQVTRRAT